jgi:hypothetical protein
LHGAAMELKPVAMEGVGAGLCNNIDNSPGIASILGGIVARLNAEFLQCVWKREWLVRAGVDIVVVVAIHPETGLVITGTVDGQVHRGRKSLVDALIGIIGWRLN